MLFLLPHAFSARSPLHALQTYGDQIPSGAQQIASATDYWAMLLSLNLHPTYTPRSQAYSLETHGSHTVNGVQLIPGAPGYDPQVAYGQWVSLLSPRPPAPDPTLTFSWGAAGFTVALNVAGDVAMSVSGSLGSFAAGSTVLTEQVGLKEGYLTLSANGKTSTATSQYVVLGTSGADTIDFSALSSRNDYIFGGAGADTLKGGAGDDVIHGGNGNDTITGGTGIDRLTGGAGQNRFVQNQSDSAYVDDPGSTIANRTATGSLDDGDILKFPNGQIDVVTDFDSTKDVLDASAAGTHYTDGLRWMNFVRGQGHYARGNWNGTDLFTIDYAAGRDILYFVSLNGANLAFNAFDIADGGIVLVGAGTTGFTAANIV